MKYGKSKTAFILLISLIYQRLTSELHFCSGSRSPTPMIRMNCVHQRLLAFTVILHLTEWSGECDIYCLPLRSRAIVLNRFMSETPAISMRRKVQFHNAIHFQITSIHTFPFIRKAERRDRKHSSTSPHF